MNKYRKKIINIFEHLKQKLQNGSEKESMTEIFPKERGDDNIP